MVYVLWATVVSLVVAKTQYPTLILYYIQWLCLRSAVSRNKLV